MESDTDGCSEEFLQAMERFDKADREYMERWRQYWAALSEDDRVNHLAFMAYLRG